MDAAVIGTEKPRFGVEAEGKRAGVRGRKASKGIIGLLRRIYGWSLIDGDKFLESKDWPYIWKK